MLPRILYYQKSILRISTGCINWIIPIYAPYPKTLFDLSPVAGQLMDPVTAAKEFDVEHQLVTGSNLQLLIDATVMLFTV